MKVYSIANRFIGGNYAKLTYNFTMQNSNFYRESNVYLRPPMQFPVGEKINGPAEYQMLQFVLNNSKKGDPANVIDKIDEFCMVNWMMNLGPEKGKVVKEKAFNKNVKKVLEIGGYCGYSALVFANEIKDRQGSMVYTIQINKNYAQIAKRIHQHAGLAHKIQIHTQTTSASENFLKQKGPFDLIFIDHVKKLYLQDFKRIEQAGVIKKGTVVVGDNIIFPGCPDYLAYFQQCPDYDSTLYHAYLEYTNDPDAVLVSVKK